jgi:hypothetical protein
MGRANSQIVYTGFDAILGTRRGSALAQKQRDVDEERARTRLRDNAFLDFADTVAGFANPAISANALKQAYNGELDESKLTEILWDELQSPSGFDALKEVAAFGDPVGWPGLTAPAVQFLAQHFDPAHVDSEAWRYDVSPQDYRSVLCVEANGIVLSCLSETYDAAYYVRLLPLYQSLGALLASAGKTLEGANFATNAAAALRQAPTSALTGPLLTWVQAFTQRAVAGELSAGERQQLRLTVGDQKSKGEIAAVFADIANIVVAVSRGRPRPRPRPR